MNKIVLDFQNPWCLDLSTKQHLLKNFIVLEVTLYPNMNIHYIFRHSLIPYFTDVDIMQE